jgi:hypothetical protein
VSDEFYEKVGYEIFDDIRQKFPAIGNYIGAR